MKKKYVHQFGEKRKKWNRIEQGLDKDDYHNYFLSHFGFYDNNEIEGRKSYG